MLKHNVWGPVALQRVNTDISVIGNVGMVYFGDKVAFRGRVWVVRTDDQLQSESASKIRSPLLNTIGSVSNP